MAGDIDEDCLQLLLDEQQGAFDALMHESTGNVKTANNVVRLSAARKFNQEDPIEAAATEMILQKTA